MQAVAEFVLAAADLFHEALGWLAREEKIRFDVKGKSMRVHLR